MPGRILTEVSAVVDPSRDAEVVAKFRDLSATALPPGLLRTELLRGPEGRWRIHSLWRDRQALEAMRAGPEPPAAPQLFRSVGAEPTLQILEVELDHVASESE